MTQFYTVHLTKDEALSAIEPVSLQINLLHIENSHYYTQKIVHQLNQKIDFFAEKYKSPLSPLFQAKVYFLDKEIFQYKFTLTYQDKTPILSLNKKFLPNMDYEKTVQHIEYIQALTEKEYLEKNCLTNDLSKSSKLKI